VSQLKRRNIMSDAQLLAPSIWQKHVFTGQWVAGTGDVLAVKAPASDATLGHIGSAASEQVDAVAEKSNAAATAWANTPYDERAAIMRQAARTAEEHQDELIHWLIDESGSTPAKAAFEVAISIKVLHEAAS
jgi:benzaldehyde dehydrogenase (NAD)